MNAMTFDVAQDAFRHAPSAKTAADYLDQAMTYYSDEMIGSDTFGAALIEIRDGLRALK